MVLAYIDESGDRGLSTRASPHFVLSACVVGDVDSSRIHTFLQQLREDLGRPSNSYLSWKNFRSHSQRIHIAQAIGGQDWLLISASVVCKRFLPPTSMNESQLYLYSFRYVLERLSWIGRDRRSPAEYTLAHIIRFQVSELRSYEAALRATETNIAWEGVGRPGQIDQPKRRDELQLADLVASAIGAAFNPDEFGNVEIRYLHELAARIYRYQPSSAVTSYGLKMHPWNDMTKAAYPWIAAL